VARCFELQRPDTRTSLTCCTALQWEEYEDVDCFLVCFRLTGDTPTGGPDADDAAELTDPAVEEALALRSEIHGHGLSSRKGVGGGVATTLLVGLQAGGTDSITGSLLRMKVRRCHLCGPSHAAACERLRTDAQLHAEPARGCV
jgi:hypothetical protein